MRPTCACALALTAALIVCGGASRAQESRPLPDREAFFDAVRHNLARAERDQDLYAYDERRTDLHVNPFGSRIGTAGSRVYEVTPEGNGIWYRKLIERDGKPVTDSEPERLDRRDRRGSSSGRSSLDDVVRSLQFDVRRREMVDGRDTIVVSFAPARDAKPETREGRLAVNFKGNIWIDEAASEVLKVDAVAINDLSLGFGLIARLNDGTTAAMTRAPVGVGVWLPTSVRFIGEGRAMLFRKLTVDYVINWFDYRKVR